MKSMFYGLMSRSTMIALVLLASCSMSPQDVARTALSVTTQGVRAVDIVSAQAYTDHAREALAASTDMAAYSTAMAPYDTLEEALRITDEALLAAEAAIDAWDHGGAARWAAVAACVAAALQHIRAAITAAHLPMPSELVVALDTATQFVGACPDPTAAVPSSGGAS